MRDDATERPYVAQADVVTAATLRRDNADTICKHDVTARFCDECYPLANSIQAGDATVSGEVAEQAEWHAAEWQRLYGAAFDEVAVLREALAEAANHMEAYGRGVTLPGFWSEIPRYRALASGTPQDPALPAVPEATQVEMQRMNPKLRP